MRTLLWAIGLAALIGAPACDILDDENAGSGAAIAYEDVDLRGLQVVEPMTVLFESQDEWAEFWNDHRVDDEPPPVLDFSGKLLVGLFWSPRGGCPQEIDVIEGVLDRGDLIEVVVGPLPDLGDCEALIHPSQAILFATLGRPVLVSGVRPD